MNSIMMWGLRDPDGQMHMVSTMAQAYVTQKQNPGWDAFILRIPESGIYEIDRGPVEILQRRRLYGDPTRPIFSVIGRTILALNAGYAISEFIISRFNPLWLIPIIGSILGIVFFRKQDIMRLELALLRGRAFFREVSQLAGDDAACDAVREWWTKGESDDDGEYNQDAGQPEGDWKDRQGDPDAARSHNDQVR